MPCTKQMWSECEMSLRAHSAAILEGCGALGGGRQLEEVGHWVKSGGETCEVL